MAVIFVYAAIFFDIASTKSDAAGWLLVITIMLTAMAVPYFAVLTGLVVWYGVWVMLRVYKGSLVLWIIYIVMDVIASGIVLFAMTSFARYSIPAIAGYSLVFIAIFSLDIIIAVLLGKAAKNSKK